jgi:integrase
MNLSAKTVAKLTLPDGKTDQTFWDDELTGFGYRLRRRGGRVRASWIVLYRAQGRVRRITLGDSAVLSATQARTAARSTLAQIALGKDPLGEKAKERQEAKYTVRAVIADYLEAKALELRPSSLRVTRLYLTGSYFQPLHALPINAVTRSAVAPCIRALERKRGTATAGAARRALSAFFAWSIAEGLLGDGANPVSGTHRPADPKARERVLSDAELKAIWNACGDDDFGRITRLLILLGIRRQEIGGLRFSELDAGIWTLPAERSKNGHGVKVPLSPAALALIAKVERTERDCLFGERADGFTSWDYAKAALDERLAGSVAPWRLHDIRRTVATGMADIGVLPHVIEAVLNHHGGHRKGPAGVYNRSQYERDVKAALLRWSEHVCALVEGRPTKGKVVNLRG